MRILDLARKDLLQVRRDPMAAFFLLLMPIIFTLMFGFTFGGFGGPAEGDPRLPVGFLDEDGGALAGRLRTLLASSEVMRVEAETGETRSSLEEAVADRELAAAIIVPAGYDQALRTGEALPLTLIADLASDAGSTVRGEVETAALKVASAAETARVATETYATVQGTASADDSFFTAALEAALAAWETPPLATVTTAASGVEGADSPAASDNAFAHSSPGLMAMFAIAGLLTAAQVLVLERKSCSLQRLLTVAVSRVEILVGHYLAMFLMIFTQLLLLILFAQLFLRLDYLAAPLATLILLLSTSLFCASLGLLIGAVARTEEQAIIFSLLLMFVLAGVGGAWFPLELTPEAFQRIAFLTPVAWIVEGLKDIAVRGLGLDAALASAAVLMAYAVGGLGLAVWRFRIE